MKTKHLLAAALVAVGVSAQAGQADLGTYAVVTLPVAAGYNFYGISVGVSDGAKWSDVITFADGDTTSLIINGVSGKTAAESAAQGAYAWYQTAANYQGGNKVYQFGKDISAESQSLTVIPGAPAYFVSKKDLTLASFEALQQYSGKVNGTKASRLSVWNPTAQTYDQYFYRNVTDTAKAGWYLGSVKQETSLKIPVGTPIYVQVGTTAPAAGVALSL